MNIKVHQRLLAFAAALLINWAIVDGLHELGAQVQVENWTLLLAQGTPARG